MVSARSRILTLRDALQVIGVVKTGKYAFLTEQPRPYLYLPLRQNYTSPTIFHIRTAETPATLVPALRRAIRALDRDLPVYNVKTMQEHLQHGYVFSTIILGGALSGLVGTLGVALASIGLYGVVANTVSQRTHEIGIRTALGASSSNVLRLVMKQGMILDHRSFIIYTIIISSILYFQRNTTGAALISSKY